jgi:tetratricopeptide (TPR) repeat protein
MMSFFRGRRPAERTSTAFRWFEDRLFPTVEYPAYAGRRGKGFYSLEIHKSGYFAWETADLPRGYDDFILEGKTEIDPSNGYSAVGFVLRYINEQNFYTFLVSSRRFYRFDLLFNNHPLTLIGWTALPEEIGEAGREGGAGLGLRIIAHGSHFSFYVDEEWVGEVEDESLGTGAVGFAAQNFGESEKAAFRLRSFSLEARPVVVEREYLRWVHYMPHLPASRLALAETLYAQESYSAAAVQLRRGLKGREGGAREHFLLAECFLKLSLLDKAMEHIEEVLSREPAHKDALFEKANLLYLTNEFLRARDYIKASMGAGTLEPAPALWNLLGNTEYALGNWVKSAQAYGRAVELQPEIPLFLKNLARSLEMEGRREEALESYLRAARILFRDQEYDGLSLILPRILAIDAANREGRALEAKMIYQEGGREEAARRLQRLAEEGTPDSAVYYLLGIIGSENGAREEALGFFEKAAEIEPSFPLYHFRLAECRYLLGRDPRDALERARSLDPRDPWINNLYGLLSLDAGEWEDAASFLWAAHDRAPGEMDILMNLSEALARSGQADEALALIEARMAAGGESSRLANQKGNLLVRKREFDEAVRAYEAAIRLDPKNAVYMENCASACLEIDMVHRAEELLARLEQSNPSASVYNLLGNAAVLKGEYPRAELAYTAGLGLSPENLDLKTNLGMLHLERERYTLAKSIIEEVLQRDPGHARARTLHERMRSRYEDRLSCSSCGREWWVPKVLPAQPPLIVKGEPPAEAPAGRCGACGKVYCIGCASAHLVDKRFHCADCGQPLKLSDNALRFLLNEYIEGRAPSVSLTKPS